MRGVAPPPTQIRFSWEVAKNATAAEQMDSQDSLGASKMSLSIESDAKNAGEPLLLLDVGTKIGPDS